MKIAINKNGIPVLQRTVRHDALFFYEQTCLNKRHFLTEVEAVNALRVTKYTLEKNGRTGLGYKDIETLDYYRCPYCKGYHLGHDKFKEKNN